MRKWKSNHSACLVLAGALIAAPAMAASGSQHLRHATPQSSGDSEVQHGVQVAIDPVTGQVRAPTDAERKALSAAMKRQQVMRVRSGAAQRPQTMEQARATLRTHARGQVGGLMQVPQDHLNYVTAERSADGNITVHHQGDTQAPKAREAIK